MKVNKEFFGLNSNAGSNFASSTYHTDFFISLSKFWISIEFTYVRRRRVRYAYDFIRRFSDIFKGYRKRITDLNGLKTKGNANPASIYLLKVNYRNSRTRCEIYIKVNSKDNEVIIVNFEHISLLVLLFLLLTLNI